ncbi:MAG: exopolyphosphatase [Thermodesulfobacteriota bacterium]
MRLVTRSDFDGLVCAVLLEEVGVVDEYLFVHPKDVQDGQIEVTRNDVLANVPYVAGCGLWFDHHSSEEERLHWGEDFRFQGASRQAPSCARVIYDYYGGPEKFKRFDESGLMPAVDQADSADFTLDEILSPKGWILLSFIMDARTGLGRYRDYRISNLELMRDMIKYCRTMGVAEILGLPDVKERVDRYFHQDGLYREMIRTNAAVHGNVLVVDLRNVEEIYSGNRFLEYALYPDQNVSLRVIWGRARQNVVFTAGHSIVNRECKSDIGSLMLKHGGGGHLKVGTCQVPTEKAEKVKAELIEGLRE